MPGVDQLGPVHVGHIAGQGVQDAGLGPGGLQDGVAEVDAGLQPGKGFTDEMHVVLSCGGVRVALGIPPPRRYQGNALAGGGLRLPGAPGCLMKPSFALLFRLLRATARGSGSGPASTQVKPSLGASTVRRLLWLGA